MSVGPGTPEPLGVTPTAHGANVAVVSANASAIELCRFDKSGRHEQGRITLPKRTGDVWHGFVQGMVEGERYGLRAHGPYDPGNGHRFNPAKLLVDPYARALDRPFAFAPAMVGGGDAPGTWEPTDSADFVPKGIVTRLPAAATSVRPRVPWSRTVIYELNVRGFTRAHPGVPDLLRGTLRGLAHPAALAHLTSLDITTVELMPIAAWINERHLAALGLDNYWGYNPIAPFVPDPRLAPGGIEDVHAAVAALHAAGLEVILDVVLNHTGEGDALGPTLSLRGLDNATYYRTFAADRARYVDDTGCGNALALDRAPVLRLALDALRAYAVVGVDGFRFDLATTLGRRDEGFDDAAPLLSAIAQDPLLRSRKLIAEPWDVGAGGYRLGAFPAVWGEWNDRYRDAVRRFWRGDAGRMAELATRLAGSADIFAERHRSPSRSINFVAAHDGFTLADLVSYADKHNEANGEGNRDGSNAGDSWNHGVEGPTADAAILAARARDVRNLLATLFLSRGTPMLAMGDELGRTQQGNNNAYAQDNALTWIDWAHADGARVAFVTRLVALRKQYPALREDRWLTGAALDGQGLADVEWRHPDGRSVEPADWTNADARALVMLLRPSDASGGAAGEIAVAYNAGDGPVDVHWPAPRDGFAWHCCIDTALATGMPDHAEVEAIDATRVAGRSLVVVVQAPGIVARRRASGVSPDVLDALGAAAGIAPDWWDVAGKRHIVGDETKRALLAAMGMRVDSNADARAHLAVLMERHGPRAPRNPEAAAADRGTGTASARCFLPPALLAGARRFGLAAHLYALRRDGDQGIGDFTTLAETATATAGAGGSIVGINPLHALFPGDRKRASPYHPSDRRFLDPIYVDVDRVPDLAASDEARRVLAQEGGRIAALAARADVDYDAVWQVKARVLDACFACFDLRPPGDPLAAEFERFTAAGGTALARFALFEAIAAEHPRMPWPEWPQALREPEASGTGEFARRNARRIRFALYLQWLADRQFAAAARDARAAGLELGFLRDLAVGAAPDGAEVWAHPSAFARGVAIGAPPDPFAQDGQNWNLPPPIPDALLARGSGGLRELVAANMRHAGALRIDHVMGLDRLFWIPDGARAVDGAYVRYPLESLIGAVAEESVRARCIVVGEDLGTVPEGFRERLAAADILSYRVLWFERDGTRFAPPARYPARSVAAVSTHDLPTIAGWWAGADIAEKAALGLLDGTAAAAASSERAEARHALAEAIDAAGVAAGAPLSADAPFSDDVTAAVHRFAGAAASALVLLQADDLAGETSALNLPGTDRERPNWRRKVRVARQRAVEHALRAPGDRRFRGHPRPTVTQGTRIDRARRRASSGTPLLMLTQLSAKS